MRILTVVLTLSWPSKSFNLEFRQLEISEVISVAASNRQMWLWQLICRAQGWGGCEGGVLLDAREGMGFCLRPKKEGKEDRKWMPQKMTRCWARKISRERCARTRRVNPWMPTNEKFFVFPVYLPPPYQNIERKEREAEKKIV